MEDRKYKYGSSFILGNSTPDKFYKMKIEIAERYKAGESFTVIDEHGDLEYMAEHLGFKYKTNKLSDGKSEITYNPV